MQLHPTRQPTRQCVNGRGSGAGAKKPEPVHFHPSVTAGTRVRLRNAPSNLDFIFIPCRSFNMVSLVSRSVDGSEGEGLLPRTASPIHFRATGESVRMCFIAERSLGNVVETKKARRDLGKPSSTSSWRDLVTGSQKPIVAETMALVPSWGRGLGGVVAGNRAHQDSKPSEEALGKGQDPGSYGIIQTQPRLMCLLPPGEGGGEPSWGGGLEMTRSCSRGLYRQSVPCEGLQRTSSWVCHVRTQEMMAAYEQEQTPVHIPASRNCRFPSACGSVGMKCPLKRLTMPTQLRGIRT